MSQSGHIYDSYHEYDLDNYQSNDRFYVRSSVYLPGSEVDPRTGMLRPDSQRKGRTQALRMEADQLDQEYAKLDAAIQARRKEKGIWMPIRYSVLLVLAFVFMLALILLVQQGNVIQRQKSLKAIYQKIESAKAANAELEAQIAEASDSATVCYAAARDLDMVPASSAQAIHLTAMDTRPSGPSDTVNVSADGQAIADAAKATGQ